MAEHIVKVTTTGGAGVSAGSATTVAGVRGFIESIQVDYHASAPATTDVTVTEAAGMARTLLTLTNNATDKIVYPRVLTQGNTGADLTGVYTRYYVPGIPVTVTLAQCDDLTNAVVVRINTSEY